nr:3344_t:CDS:2 [Entrophospora candida]
MTFCRKHILLQVKNFNIQGISKEKCAKRMEEIQNLLKNNIIKGEINLTGTSDHINILASPLSSSPSIVKNKRDLNRTMTLNNAIDIVNQ